MYVATASLKHLQALATELAARKSKTLASACRLKPSQAGASVHLRRGEDTYAIDATARSTLSQPVAVPHACCTLGRCGRTDCSGPREAAGSPRSRQKTKAMLRAATRVAARHARRPPPRRRALAAVQYVPAQAAPMLLSTAPLALGGRPLLDGALAASSSSVVASVAGDNKDDDGR